MLYPKANYKGILSKLEELNAKLPPDVRFSLSLSHSHLILFPLSLSRPLLSRCSPPRNSCHRTCAPSAI
jgi:hypothetical protein